MNGKSIQFAANAVLMNRQKNLMTINFTIFLSNLKKKKKKKKSISFKSFQYSSLNRRIEHHETSVRLYYCDTWMHMTSVLPASKIELKKMQKMVHVMNALTLSRGIYMAIKSMNLFNLSI